MRRGLIAVVTVTLTLLALPTAAHAASVDDLVASRPPAGFVVSTRAGVANGPIDAATARQLSGSSSGATGNVQFDGVGRTWENARGDELVVIVARTSDAATASRTARDSIRSESALQGSSRFSSGIDGIDGVAGQRGQVYVKFISWSQGPYVVATALVTPASVPSAPIREMATRQADFLRTRFTVDVDRTSDGSEVPSPFFIVGSVLAPILLVAALIVGAVVVRGRRRSGRRPASTPPVISTIARTSWSASVASSVPQTGEVPSPPRETTTWDDRFPTREPRP